MCKASWIIALLLTIPVCGCQRREPAALDPASLTAQLELRLTANQDTYVLSRGGASAEHAQQPLQDYSPTDPPPAVPQVDLTLELHNRGAGEVSIPVGTRDWYTLKLEGPGAVEAVEPGMWCIPAADISVEAGKRHSVSLRQIRYFRGKGTTIGRWTRPGEYTLTAEAQVRVHGQEVTVRSKPVHFKVVDGPL